MRDGTVLRADVYLPHPLDGARYPTILMRNSYDKKLAHYEVDTEFFASRGYAVVVQDIRGRHSSEGSHYHGRSEVDDGYDTLEWIAAQPWSDGKVGMTGISYGAALQCATALSGTPHLASIFHVKAPSNYYKNAARHGGNMPLYLVTISLIYAATSPEAKGDPVLRTHLMDEYEHGVGWIDRTPWKKGQNPLSQQPDLEQFHLDCQHRHLYDDFWKRVRLWQPEEYVDEYADVPGLYVGGWYDFYREDTFFPLLAHRKQKRVSLLMGPWTHLSFDRVSGDVDFGPDADFGDRGYTELQLKWFEYSLKGIQDPVATEPRVKVFVMGGGDGTRTADGHLNHGGQWRYADDWPIPETQYTKFFLGSGGRLMLHAPEGDEPPSRYTHDPHNPVPTIGGASYFRDKGAGVARGAPANFLVPYGPHDQREQLGMIACTSNLPLASRHDVLVFETPALEEPVEVTGVISARLWFSTTALDTDFTIKLVDVYPPSADYPSGYALNVADGIMRASYVPTFESRELLEPGRVYELEIASDAILSTGALFAIGHKIRVDVASSNYPAFDINPGNGDHIMNFASAVRADNTVFQDAERPSHVVLPIIPA